MGAERSRNIRDLEGAQAPAAYNDLLGYARQSGVTVHDLQRELNIAPYINLDQERADRTREVAMRIRPLVEAAVELVPIDPLVHSGFARVRNLAETSVVNLLQEKLELPSLFAGNPDGTFSISADVGREVAVTLGYSFRSSDAASSSQFLYVFADPESGMLNLDARQRSSLLYGEAGVLGVPGMMDALMADIELFGPPADNHAE